MNDKSIEDYIKGCVKKGALGIRMFRFRVKCCKVIDWIYDIAENYFKLVIGGLCIVMLLMGMGFTIIHDVWETERARYRGIEAARHGDNYKEGNREENNNRRCAWYEGYLEEKEKMEKEKK